MTVVDPIKDQWHKFEEISHQELNTINKDMHTYHLCDIDHFKFESETFGALRSELRYCDINANYFEVQDCRMDSSKITGNKRLTILGGSTIECEFHNFSEINTTFNAYLFKCEFNGLIITNSKMATTQFLKCKFINCAFDRCQIINCDFRESVFKNCKFFNCQQDKHTIWPDGFTPNIELREFNDVF